MVADRIGAGRVLLVGVLLVALGTALVPFATTTASLVFAIGVLAAGGAGMAGPSVLMAATTRLVPSSQRGLATGIVNAGGSFGQFLFAPIAQGVSAAAGWVAAVQTLAAASLLALPAAWVLKGNALAPAGVAATASPRAETTREAVRRALADPSFRLLSAGFFVCGFHVAFIATHLPGVVASCQLPPEVGAWALAVIGLFNIAGSFGIGWAIGHGGGRWRMKSLLSLVYATRALAVLAFLAAPKTATVMLVFAAVLGLTYLSTVPPTAGLVAKLFGTAHMGTLFGLVMLAHQIGGFLGAWLGGKAFEASGSYDWMWYADVVLAVGAALVHLPIREARPGLRMQAA
jgi:predicted MFS family arabinose efflux permease